LLAGVLVGQGQVLGGPVVSLTAQGGALRAVVYPVTGEVAHSITVVLRTAGSRCVRRATLGGSPLTLECAFAHSSEKRLGTVSVSGGWGRSQSALLF
jgi:hypothetical protein